MKTNTVNKPPFPEDHIQGQTWPCEFCSRKRWNEDIDYIACDFGPYMGYGLNSEGFVRFMYYCRDTRSCLDGVKHKLQKYLSEVYEIGKEDGTHKPKRSDGLMCTPSLNFQSFDNVCCGKCGKRFLNMPLSLHDYLDLSPENKERTPQSCISHNTVSCSCGWRGCDCELTHES